MENNLIQKEAFRFGIIGAGKAGLTLAIEIAKQQRLKWIVARSLESQNRVIQTFFSDSYVRKSIDDLVSLPELTVVAVPDGAINQVAEQIATKFHADIRGKYFVHLSGVLGRDALQPLRDLGASIAAVHPFQTFYHQAENILTDIRWGIDAADDDYDLYSNFVNFLYGFPIRLSEETLKDKALYHAVAVSASNYMTTIMQLAHKIADSAKVDSSQFLPPIAKTTLGNNLRGLADNQIPLTGPISRGDIETIKLHLKSMMNKPHLLQPYCLMGLATLEMAHTSELVDTKTYNKIKSLLKIHIKL